eukprot:TRINITY_DN16736_c0_g1_i1.p1 TRINITY_DN16736_c0_g1~~TRINITY_DN16736_c0_g1_i1.p1  ORF type:complete len:430 (-),score=143.66 TRINITY_DN16736_c0_g1_i1:340-1629(-)
MSDFKDFRPFSAYIVDACRTAGGKKGGSLSGWHPADLGAAVCDALIERTKTDGSKVDDVVMGCVSQIGAQAGNLARFSVLASKHLPESVPGTTVDRQCGSSQQALHFAAQAVMSGNQDVVIAGGIEVMSLVPIGSNIGDSFNKGVPGKTRGLPISQSIKERYDKAMEEGYGAVGIPTHMFSQFGGAEMLAKKYDMKKEDLDAFAARSQQRGHAATQAGKFKDEIVAIEKKKMLLKEGEQAPSGLHTQDEGIRPKTTAESLAKVKALHEGGVVSAAASSQICDGASAVLLCNERGLAKLGLKPLARIVGMSVAASDPVTMLEGPVFASQNLLKQTSMSIKDIDLYEVNEAFAPVPMAFAKALGADEEKLNVNGGACALGHPLGATGTKLMATLVHELKRRGGRYGLLSICEGGGTANATIIEMSAASSKL